MANNFAEAFFGGMQDAQKSSALQQQNEQARLMNTIKIDDAQQKRQVSQQEALYGLAKGYKDYLANNPQGGAQYYERFLKPSLAGLGLGDAGPYNEPEAVALADQVLAAYVPAQTQAGSGPRVVGNALVDPTGKVLYQAAQEAPKPIWDSARGVFVIPPTSGINAQTSGVPTSNPITGTDFGIGETNNYVRSILGKVGKLDPNASPEQMAERLLPFLIQQESGGDPNAISPKGAQGLTQVMPTTGQNPGFGVSPLQNNTPQENVRFGRDYLTAMLRRYPGRPDLALAAYNAGPGVADRFAGSQASAGPQVIPVEGISPRQTENIPSGYRPRADGQGLEPIPGGPADKQNNPVAADLAKGERDLRRETQDRIKQDRSVLNMFTNVQNAARSGSAAGDLSLIFAFMKMLDPGSVVREQEFANAQNAAGIPDRILNYRNQILRGERLNPGQREQFMNEARQLAGAAQDRITAVTREQQNIAQDYGWDPTRATGMADFRDVNQARPQSSPARPTSDAEYSALPSGTQFIDPDDGQLYTKP